jgi:hypothetical protein
MSALLSSYESIGMKAACFGGFKKPAKADGTSGMNLRRG